MNYINASIVLLLFVIGYFIKVKKVTWLISGYNTASQEEKQKYDINKLCRHMGNFIYLLASTWAIMTIFTIIFAQHIALIMIIGTVVFTVVIVGGIVRLNTGNRVKKD